MSSVAKRECDLQTNWMSINADDRMMLEQHRSGDHVISLREFGQISWAKSIGWRVWSRQQEGQQERATNNSLYDACARLKISSQ